MNAAVGPAGTESATPSAVLARIATTSDFRGWAGLGGVVYIDLDLGMEVKITELD
jgi:hypothetical protein